VGSQNGSIFILDTNLKVVFNKDLKIGKLLSGAVNRDTNYILISGGSDGNIAVLDFEQYV